MQTLAAVLVAALVLTVAYGVMQGRGAQQSRMSEAIAGVFARGRRPASPQARKRVAARLRPEDQDPLPWPFSTLDTLQQQAGEYEGPLRILLTIVLAAVGLGTVAWLLTGQVSLTAGAALAGIAVPAILLKAKASRRMAAIEDQVSGVCLRLSQALTAGAAVERALADVAREVAAPFGDELRLVMRDVTQGVPLDVALGNLTRRLPEAPSVRMLVASLQISLEMGADLAEQLARIAEIIRDRRLAFARISGVTATARIQSKVLSFVPLAAYVWVHLSSPQTLAGYEGPMGQLKLLAMAGWVVLGYAFTGGLLNNTFGGVL